MNNGDLKDGIKRKAGQHFKEGYNCAESILRAFNHELGLGLSDDALKMGSGFGGGLGHSGCVCGALAASVMVLGVLQGRSNSKQDRDPVYRASEGFHSKFIDAFGGTCCRMLNPYPFETKEHLLNCLKLTGNTAELLKAYIEEKGLKGNHIT